MSDDKDKTEETRACPTQGGTMVGYSVEVYREEGWREVTFKKGLSGVPSVSRDGDAAGVLGFHGYNQAMALAHWHKCNQMHGDIVDRAFTRIRIVPYEIEYDIKAFKQEDRSIDVRHYPDQPKKPQPDER